MPETFFMVDQGEYVLCRYVSPLATGPLIDVCRALSESCREQESEGALIDLRQSQGQIGVLERYTLAEAVAEFWDLQVKLAVLVRADQMMADRFWQTAARNRGLWTKVFTNLQSAQQWLLTTQPQSRPE